MLRLTADQIDRAKSFILDILICAGIASNTRSLDYTSSSYYCILNPDTYDSFKSKYKSASVTIAHAITRRTFNFKEVDEALAMLKRTSAEFGTSPKAATCDWKIRLTKTAAKYIAWVCAQNKIYWDDTAYTPAERSEFVASSEFAAALYEAECFVSQPATVKRTRTTTVSDDGVSTTSATSGAPKSGYKSAGAQSANVAGLVSKPGEKEKISSSVVYCIIGAKAGAIIPNAFIHPVENPSVGAISRVNSAGLPIVKFGAGNGYTDITIYSPDKAFMESIMSKLSEKGLLAKYTDVRVVGVKVNAGGYYRVNCEYGEVLIKPTKLNEQLFTEAFEEMKKAAESLVEDTTAEKAEQKTEAILDMNKFVRDSKMYD